MLWIERKPSGEISEMEHKARKWHFRFVMAYSLILTLIVVYYLPLRFQYQAGVHMTTDMMREESMPHGHEDEGADHGATESADHMMGREDAAPATAISGEIGVDLTVAPGTLRTGEPADLTFNVFAGPEKTPVQEEQLDIVHEKPMHAIGVREDLTQFFHIHPLPSPVSEGVLSTSFVFPMGGKYNIWSEISIGGKNFVFTHGPISVQAAEPAVYETARELKKDVIVDRYQVTLAHDILGVGANTVEFTVRTLEGNGVRLEKYLGEDMHLAVISEDLSQFLHAHPGDHGMMMEGGGMMNDGHMDADEHSRFANTAFAHGGDEPAEVQTVAFGVPFAKPGYYKLFAQFRPEDAGLAPDDSLTAEFWVEVGNRPAEATATAERDETESATPLSPKTAWWRNLIVSLILMVLLSIGVKRYITVQK